MPQTLLRKPPRLVNMQRLQHQLRIRGIARRVFRVLPQQPDPRGLRLLQLPYLFVQVRTQHARAEMVRRLRQHAVHRARRIFDMVFRIVDEGAEVLQVRTVRKLLQSLRQHVPRLPEAAALHQRLGLEHQARQGRAGRVRVAHCVTAASMAAVAKIPAKIAPMPRTHPDGPFTPMTAMLR